MFGEISYKVPGVGNTNDVINQWLISAPNLIKVGTLTTGTWQASIVQPQFGGLGTSSIPSNGQIPIGNGSTYTISTLTAGYGHSITNGSGSITITSIISDYFSNTYFGGV